MNPAPPPLLRRNSSLAISSLILGILTFVCLGPLAGIAAIICGHMGLSAIKNSGGLLNGRGLAIAGLVMGYAGTVLTVIALLLFAALLLPAVGLVQVQAKKAEAKTEVVSIVAAVKAYYVEYGKYPGGSSNEAEVTFSSDNNRLFDVLRARPGTDTENPRHIVFFDGKNANATPPKSGFGTDGVLYDPWGKPYFIRIGPNAEGRVTNPYSKGAGPNPIPQAVIVWSLGPNEQQGMHGDADSHAAILSWQ